jgi:choline dehydrogenase-like flavoprotein
MGGRRIYHARGKILGGSSSINGMIFQRGNPLDYEHLRDGGQGYDAMGYTQAQLIDDVLDQYEQHLEFLRLAASG